MPGENLENLNNGEWKEYRRLILSQLRDLQDGQHDLSKQLIEWRAEITKTIMSPEELLETRTMIKNWGWWSETIRVGRNTTLWLAAITAAVWSGHDAIGKVIDFVVKGLS